MRRLVRMLVDVLWTLSLIVFMLGLVGLTAVVIHGTFRLLHVPLWLCAFAPYLVLTWLRVKLFSPSPLARGACANCGYDLRATPERCPECGAVSAGANGNAEAQRRRDAEKTDVDGGAG